MSIVHCCDQDQHLGHPDQCVDGDPDQQFGHPNHSHHHSVQGLLLMGTRMSECCSWGPGSVSNWDPDWQLGTPIVCSSLWEPGSATWAPGSCVVVNWDPDPGHHWLMGPGSSIGHPDHVWRSGDPDSWALA